jgi:hypothetical protein
MKNALLYIVAVGGSVAAIAGLLYLGQTMDLDPPMSVGGTWKLEAAPDCGIARSADGEAGFRISQSGPHLEITLGEGSRTHLRGSLDGSHIAAETRPGTSSSSRARLEADVHRSGDEARLEGTLSVDGCEEAVPVHATRQKAPAGKPKVH